MGKTSLLVSELLLIGDRPVFVDGIKDLLVPHFEAEDVNQWHDWLPEGALLVVDECQRYFRPRIAGSQVPASVQAFETHRHRGADIWLITQAPNFLDANVRRLVGRHIHIRDTVLGRHLYEGVECGEPESKMARDNATKRKFSPPKKVFSLYKSAEVHTKQKRRMSRLPLVFGGALIALLVVGWNISNSLAKHLPGAQDEMAKGVASPEGQQGLKSNPTGSVLQENQEKTSIQAKFTPPDIFHEFTAPAYDHLRQVRAMPYPSACVMNVKRCRCYPEQGTPLDTLPDDECRRFATTPTFNPYEGEDMQVPARLAQTSGHG